MKEETRVVISELAKAVQDEKNWKLPNRENESNRNGARDLLGIDARKAFFNKLISFKWFWLHCEAFSFSLCFSARNWKRHRIMTFESFSPRHNDTQLFEALLRKLFCRRAGTTPKAISVSHFVSLCVAVLTPLVCMLFFGEGVNDDIIEFYGGAWLCVCMLSLQWSYSWDYSNNKYSMWNNIP